MPRLFPLLLLLPLLSCNRLPEGINTGECQDLLDNDVDGLVDCFDPDCVNSGQCGTVASETQCSDNLDNDADGFVDCNDPDCAANTACGGTNEPGPVVDPADVDCTAPTGTFANSDISSVTLDYTIDFNFDAFCDSLCGLTPQLCDCSGTYRFEGDLVATGAELSQFEGTWTRLSTTCLPGPGDTEGPNGEPPDVLLDSLIWWNFTDPSAYLTMWWSGQGSTVSQYTVHAVQNNCEPLEEGFIMNKQVFEPQLDMPYSASDKTASKQDAVDITVDLCEANIATDIRATFR